MTEDEKALAEAFAAATRAMADVHLSAAGTTSQRRPEDIAAETAEADLKAKQIANDKARAEVDKARAEVDKARADVEKARADQETARVDKLIERLTGAVPDVSSMSKNTVTFADGRALRQSEAIGLAVGAVAKEVADTVRPALSGLGEERLVLFVTGETSMVAAVAGYWQLVLEAEHLRTALIKAIDDANKELAPEETDDEEGEANGDRGGEGDSSGGGSGSEADTGQVDLVPGVAAVAAAALGKAATEVASLFEVDTSVTSNASDVAALGVQAQVLQHLLRRPRADGTPEVEGAPVLDVQLHWTRVPDATGRLRTAVGDLIEKDIGTATAAALLDAAIATLGDPAATRDKALKDAKDTSLGREEREAAKATAVAASTQVTKLGALKDKRTTLTAVVQKVKAFADRVTTVSATTGQSPLTAAYAIEPLTAEDTKPAVLVIGPARAETYQMVVARRILPPRLHVSTGVEVDFVLLHGQFVRAAGHATASAAYAAKLKGTNADWSTSAALTLDPGSTTRWFRSRSTSKRTGQAPSKSRD